MCGRFAQFNPLDILKARFEIETITATVAPCYNIAPTAQGPIKTIHDRMPAIVAMDRIRDWLSPDFSDLAMYEQILAGHCITDLRAHPVSALVNSAGFDSPQCIEDIGMMI